MKGEWKRKSGKVRKVLFCWFMRKGGRVEWKRGCCFVVGVVGEERKGEGKVKWKKVDKWERCSFVGGVK